jgi:hypothetical protein
VFALTGSGEAEPDCLRNKGEQGFRDACIAPAQRQWLASHCAPCKGADESYREYGEEAQRSAAGNAAGIDQPVRGNTL